MSPDRVAAMVNAMIEECPFTQLSVPPTLYVEWRAWEDMARAALDQIEAPKDKEIALKMIPDRAAKLAVIKGALESANEWAAKYPLYAAKYPQSSAPDAHVATMVFQQTIGALTVLANLDDPDEILVHGTAEAILEWQRLLADRDRVKAELDTLRLRLDVTTQDQQFARAQQEQEAREVARLRTELGDTRGWYENVKEELRIRTERVAALEGALQSLCPFNGDPPRSVWVAGISKERHYTGLSCYVICGACVALSLLAPDEGPARESS